MFKKIPHPSLKFTILASSFLILSLLIGNILLYGYSRAQNSQNKPSTFASDVPTPETIQSPQNGQSAGIEYFVNPTGSDQNAGTSPDLAFRTIQKALDQATAGETINLAPGVYLQNFVSKRSGESGFPITITGPKEAVVKGGANARVAEINHSYITLSGFTLDGKFDSSNSASGYRDKLLYILGKEPKVGITGTRIFNMAIRNAGGECIRLRYLVKFSEIAYNTIENCGIHDFVFGDGGKNGEGVYIGTAPEQLKDGKNPTSDPDESNNNWIHHNFFDTQGNECVDIKEAAAKNIIENNRCTGQKDSNSGGFDSRGENNIFRLNEIFDNKGAGVRLGGDEKGNGINNDIYLNIIRGNKSGGIKFQREPQGKVCGNTMEDNSKGDSVGSHRSEFKPTDPC